jgi:hypothetical protein
LLKKNDLEKEMIKTDESLEKFKKDATEAMEKFEDVKEAYLDRAQAKREEKKMNAENTLNEADQMMQQF